MQFIQEKFLSKAFMKRGRAEIINGLEVYSPNSKSTSFHRKLLLVCLKRFHKCMS